MDGESKKPLIITILIAALVVIVSVVAIAVAGSAGEPEEETAIEGQSEEEDVSYLVDLAEQKEVLPKDFESTVVNDQNYDYESISTDRDNSKNKAFSVAKEIVDTGNIAEMLKAKKVEATARKVMNSNILNFYLDHNKIVIIEAYGSGIFKDNGAVLVYGGDLLDGTYYIYRKGDVGSEPTIISKLDLFKAIESKVTFYVISGVFTNE